MPMESGDFGHVASSECIFQLESLLLSSSFLSQSPAKMASASLSLYIISYALP
jgi:hypothetical protein